MALDIFEWLVSGREITEPIPADITTYNTLIKACHQVRGNPVDKRQYCAYVETQLTKAVGATQLR